MSASILVVDDDPLLVQLMGAMLGDLGRIRFATNGPSALQQLAHDRPDLILLDAQMPGMGGFEVCRAIRSSRDYDGIPVIFVTARHDEEFEVRCFEAGAADFIHKPVSAPVLRARVRSHVRLKRAQDSVRQLALTDALTGLSNRRAFDELLTREWKHAAREGRALGMLMIDVDCFKQYNDLYGHPAGDACLASVARAMRQALHRPHDTVVRYGGEEFAVMLPDISSDGLASVAQRLLEAVRSLRIPHQGGAADGIVSISLGGAIARPFQAHDGPVPIDCPTGLSWHADQALYRAKAQGRARACLADAAPDARFVSQLACAPLSALGELRQ